ncbi:hypothetical protein DVH05_026315 [Phytophthora capsici]|nr:hypothetical protein DVH05_026315 [Phytophthora capsici]
MPLSGMLRQLVTSVSSATPTLDMSPVRWWKNTMEEYVTTTNFQNLIFDQLVNNKGKLNYCVNQR